MMTDRKRKFELPGIQDLSKEQEAARALPAEGRHLVVGGPGTGKSVLALLRARRQHRDGAPYLFLVFNHLLHQATRQLFGDRLQSRTWMSWFHEVFRQAAEEPVPKLDAGGDRFQPIDWDGVEEVIAGLTSIPDIEHPYLVIDEGQDMPPQFYSSLINLGFENFFVVADQNQQITEENSTIEEIRKVLDIDREDVISLTRNYRNPRSVAKLAGHFCTDERSSTPPELPERTAAAAPVLYEYHGDRLDQVAKGIVKRAYRNPRELIGVMAPNNAVRQRYCEALVRAMEQRESRLEDLPPRITTFHGENQTDVVFNEGGILVINAQACKGLEFDLAILADIHEHYVPATDPERASRLFYVMVARAKEQVYLLLDRNSDLSRRLEEMLPADRNVLRRKVV